MRRSRRIEKEIALLHRDCPQIFLGNINIRQLEGFVKLVRGNIFFEPQVEYGTLLGIILTGVRFAKFGSFLIGGVYLNGEVGTGIDILQQNGQTIPEIGGDIPAQDLGAPLFDQLVQGHFRTVIRNCH